MKEITAAELMQMINDKEEFKLIDVREEYEFDEQNLGGVLVPLASIAEEKDKFNSDLKVIVHCRSGSRSATAIKFLEGKFGFTNLYNLKGGIIAWNQLNAAH
jgi:rhodanese-related sulfurtransferase